jgi:hypothetical protein
MLLGGADNITVVLLQSSGLPGATTIVNYQYLSDLLGAATEATFTNYTRLQLTSSAITIAYNTASSPTTVTVSFANQTWSSAGGAVNNAIGAVALAYQPTSSTADTGCLVLATLAYSGSTTGGALNITFGTLEDA